MYFVRTTHTIVLKFFNFDINGQKFYPEDNDLPNGVTV